MNPRGDLVKTQFLLQWACGLHFHMRVQVLPSHINQQVSSNESRTAAYIRRPGGLPASWVQTLLLGILIWQLPGWGLRILVLNQLSRDADAARPMDLPWSEHEFQALPHSPGACDCPGQDRDRGHVMGVGWMKWEGIGARRSPPWGQLSDEMEEATGTHTSIGGTEGYDRLLHTPCIPTVSYYSVLGGGLPWSGQQLLQAQWPGSRGSRPPPETWLSGEREGERKEAGWGSPALPSLLLVGSKLANPALHCLLPAKHRPVAEQRGAALPPVAFTQALPGTGRGARGGGLPLVALERLNLSSGCFLTELFRASFFLQIDKRKRQPCFLVEVTMRGGDASSPVLV